MFNDLIGIPFVKGETDCWWLVRQGFKKFGIEVPNYDIVREAIEQVNYDLKLTEHIAMSFRFQWEYLEEPKIPCLVFMSMHVPDTLSHFALYIGNNEILHTLKGKNSCRQKLDHPYLKNRQKVFYKYVG